MGDPGAGIRADADGGGHLAGANAGGVPHLGLGSQRLDADVRVLPADPHVLPPVLQGFGRRHAVLDDAALHRWPAGSADRDALPVLGPGHPAGL